MYVFVCVWYEQMIDDNQEYLMSVFDIDYTA